ncbi:unnamed protein product [Cuscuta epithymum]|uniref:RNase H type-1 domain-containing protein n=1 Tax=Cuscuta epithymum TaxID=186058 RepID=A0AAV0DLU8_9ASTE|nr:unnamed protein product [Cuscuta epithymum]
MRPYWNLPPENYFRRSGPEWFLNLLNGMDSLTRARILFIFWRAWHLRNDVVHGKGDAKVSASVEFLRSYWESWIQIQYVSQNGKGKFEFPSAHLDPAAVADAPSWGLPPQGWAKLNSDASFDPVTGETTVGYIIRNCRGEVLLTGWCKLPIWPYVLKQRKPRFWPV